MIFDNLRLFINPVLVLSGVGSADLNLVVGSAKLNLVVGSAKLNLVVGSAKLNLVVERSSTTRAELNN
jgi:hypothetical protein